MGGTTDEDTSSPSMAGKERQAAINKTAVDNFIGESMFGMLGQAFGRLGEWAKSHDIPVIAADTPGRAGPDSGAAPYTGPSPSWGPGDIFGGPGASSERGSPAQVSPRAEQDPRRNLSRMPTREIEIRSSFSPGVERARNDRMRARQNKNKLDPTLGTRDHTLGAGSETLGGGNKLFNRKLRDFSPY
jgi:hypothetical protein